MNKTPIEWTDYTVNPIRARLGKRVGHYCEKVSPGCKHCYSSRMQPRFGLPQFQEQRASGAVAPFLDAATFGPVLRHRKPARIFWCDMTDIFGEWVPNEWIAACFGVMAATPHLTHQVLTKRPERAREWLAWVERAYRENRLPWKSSLLYWLAGRAVAALGQTFPAEPRHGTGWPLPNVHIGVSTEDQQRADERIPILLELPAAVRFVSAEPLIGGIDFRIDAERAGHKDWCVIDALTGRHTDMGRPCPDVPHLDWIIVGGESGPGARPCALEWIRSIVDQCRVAGVPAFVKQLGAFVVSEGRAERWHDGTRQWLWSAGYSDRKGGDPIEWPEELRVREFPRA